MITADELREFLSYDHINGVFTWKTRSRQHFTSDRACAIWNKKLSGKVAGTVYQRGYIRIRVLGNNYLAHRLAWLYMTGTWPKDEIDHTDGDKFNNCWANLRGATHAENMRNKGNNPRNTSGIKGVGWRPERGKWHARIRVDRKQISLGYFGDIKDAEMARKTAEKIFHGDFVKQ